MNKAKVLLALLLLSLTFFTGFAQPGCPQVTVSSPGVNRTGNDFILNCGDSCITLQAEVLSGFQTDSYSVAPIPYNPPFPFNSGNPILVNIDDTWSDTIQLPFNFCYFGNTYNKITVGSNGMISFNLNNANGLNSWQINGPLPSQFYGDMRNAIFTPWQDLDPTFTGLIYYQISGTYPCRSFEVSWYQTPYYGDGNSVNDTLCGGALYATHQVVLYEVSNVIEMYIQDKEVCPLWNNGRAIQGIQNANATRAYTVPGRNATQWTAHNDAWRFTPVGTPNHTLAWYEDTTLISTGTSINVCTPVTHPYSVVATYVNCDNDTTIVMDSINVVIPDITASADSFDAPSCFGGNDAVVYGSFSSNIAIPYYGWDTGGQNQFTASGLTAGTYIFSVTDSVSCSFSDTITVTDPQPLQVFVNDTLAYGCLADSIKGTLIALVSGGDTSVPYSYLWSSSPGDTLATATNLPYGSYSVIVTDGHGCTATDTAFVDTAIAPAAFLAPVITDVSCNGGNDGTIAVFLNQSNDPTSYTWSPTQPDNDTITGLIAGNYTISSSDAYGCTASASYVVNQPSAIQLGSPTIAPAVCNLGGTISIGVSGGTSPYTYSWSNGDIGNMADSVAPGPISVTVTDANLCSVTGAFTMTLSGSNLAFGNPTITNVLCFGNSNGSILVTTTGATGSVTYSWSNMQTGSSITGLAAGSYTVTATDSANCSIVATYTINQPSALVIDSASIVPSQCTTGGSIALTVHGGTGSYSYYWSNTQTTNPLTNIYSSPYFVTVTDQSGCSATGSFFVGAIANGLTFAWPNMGNVDCHGDSTGFINALVTNGAAPISYIWSNGQPTSDIDSLPTGIYTVSVSDQNGCSASTSYLVAEPDLLVPNLNLTSLICFGSNTGQASVSPTGGVGGYQYNWSVPNSGNTSVVTGLERGIVLVTVTDDNGCVATASGTINQTNQLTFVRILDLHICETPQNGDLTITVRGGIGPVTVNVAGVGTQTASMLGGDTAVTFPAITTGQYSFTLTDSLGCTTSGTFDVPAGPSPDAVTLTSTPATCFGANYTDGSVTVSTGNSPNGPYSFSLNGSPFQTDTVFANLTAATYTVTVRNSYGCEVDYNIDVTSPAQIIADAQPDTIITSPGTDNVINVTTSGFQTAVYSWTPVEGLSCSDCSNPTANVETPTVFYVTVTEDGSPCFVTDSVVIIITGGFRMPNAFTPNGDGKNDDFKPFYLGQINIKSFRIYNRWGELMHDSASPWNGAYKGKDMPAGTYVYYIKVQSADPDNPGSLKTENQEGSFTLIR